MNFITAYSWLAKIVFTGILVACSAPVLAEEGVTENTILIGQTVGISGQIAGPVKEMMAGANAYFSAINKAGGVHGRKIELRSLDDQFDPALALANAESLIRKERVLALFQSRGTPHTEAILPLLAANKIPLVAPSTGATLFHQPLRPYVFNVRAKYQDEVAKAIEQFSTVGIKKIALVHVDDTFGRDGLAGFEKAMARQKLTPASVSKFERVNPDLDSLLLEVMKSNPQAIVIVSSASTTAEIIKKMRVLSTSVQLMTLSNNASQSFVDALGSAGHGVMMSQIMPAANSLTTALGREFKLMALLNGVNPSYAAMEGFVGAKVLVEGLKRSGRNLSREGLIRAMESMHKVDLGGLLVNYSGQDHSGSEFVELTMIGKDGRFLH